MSEWHEALFLLALIGLLARKRRGVRHFDRPPGQRPPAVTPIPGVGPSTDTRGLPARKSR